MTKGQKIGQVFLSTNHFGLLSHFLEKELIEKVVEAKTKKLSLTILDIHTL